MKQLSADHSPLPKLAARGWSLEPDVLKRLAAKMTPDPSLYIREAFWGFTELLHQILKSLDFSGLDGQELERHKRSVLSSVEVLMHRCAALNDYLGKLLLHSLSTTTKKNKIAEAAKERLDTQIDRLYKIPINLVKHYGFSLRWVEMSQSSLRTDGYTVTGPIAENVYGPMKFRARKAAGTEGYSFAVSLRQIFPAIYLMCDIAEDALAGEGLFGSREPQSLPQDVRNDLLSPTLSLLNQLPLYGFPDEHQVEVPIFEIHGSAVMARSRRVRMLPGIFKIQTELGSAQAGTGFKLPYWRGS